jgi:hypothetical protein
MIIRSQEIKYRCHEYHKVERKQLYHIDGSTAEIAVLYK